MTKKIVLLLCSTALISTANAVSVDINGMGRVRSEITNNTDFNSDTSDKMNSTIYRFQVGLKIRKDENSKASVYLQPRFSKVAGDTMSGTTVSSGSLNSETSFDAHQAFISYKINSNTELIVGRQELKYGDQLLVGSVDWHNIGRAFDGIKMSYNSAWGKTDLFSMTVKEESPYTTADRDYNFNGLYHAMELESIKNLDLYLLSKEDLSGATTNTKKIVNALGLRIKSNIEQFDYRLEFTSEKVYKYSTSKADYKDYSASQFDLELGYLLGSVRLAAGIANASEHFDQLYPTGHKWLGYADFYKRQNIIQKKILVNYKMNSKTNINLHFHQFEIAETSDTTNAYRWSGPTISNNKKELGEEIDLVISHKLSSDLEILFKQAYFTPGAHYKDSGFDTAASESYLQLQTNF
jgi:hypothetical protein